MLTYINAKTAKNQLNFVQIWAIWIHHALPQCLETLLLQEFLVVR